jgi:hypothetical protein
VLSSPVWRGTPLLAFGAGLVAGGMATATVLVVTGSLVRAPLGVAGRWSLVAAALVAVLLRERGMLSFPLPENRRLVPESVFRLGRHLGPFQFGLEMGTGARTYLPSRLPYVGAIAVLLAASVPAALLAGAGFGLGRALMTTSALRFAADEAWHAEWVRHGRVLARVTAAAFGTALAVLAALAVAGVG